MYIVLNELSTVNGCTALKHGGGGEIFQWYNCTFYSSFKSVFLSEIIGCVPEKSIEMTAETQILEGDLRAPCSLGWESLSSCRP